MWPNYLFFLVSQFFQQKVESAEKLLLDTMDTLDQIVDGEDEGMTFKYSTNQNAVFFKI